MRSSSPSPSAWTTRVLGATSRRNLKTQIGESSRRNNLLTSALGAASRRNTTGVTLGSVDSGFSTALWGLYAKTGIRPEWLVPVLASESGINPAISNTAGYPYYGINQISGAYLQRLGIDPSTYLTWSASQQLNTIVTGYMQAQIAAFGPLRSGTRVYQSNFLPASLKTATSLDSVLAVQTHACTAGHTSDVYCANPGLDYTHKGTITVSDLAHFVSKQAASSYVKGIIANAYAIAPEGVGPETDPVYGLDFNSMSAPVSNWGPALGLAGGAIAAMLAWEAYRRGVFDSVLPRTIHA